MSQCDDRGGSTGARLAVENKKPRLRVTIMPPRGRTVERFSGAVKIASHLLTSSSDNVRFLRVSESI